MILRKRRHEDAHVEFSRTSPAFCFPPRVNEKRMREDEINDTRGRPKSSISFDNSDDERRLGLTRYAKKALSYLPAFMFVAAVAMASFAGGVFVVRYDHPLYSTISNGLKTLRTVLGTSVVVDDGRSTRRFSDWEIELGFEARIGSAGDNTLSESMLWYGGRFQFMDLCPEWGCLAVEFGADKEVAHVYPFRPDALEQAATDAATDEFPYELAPTFSFTRDIYPIGMSRYPNGDLLVVFHTENNTSFPFGAGAARIDRDGYPVWFRRDYSHHWPHIEEDGSALVPGHLIGSESISFRIEGTHTSTVKLDCDTGRPYRDTVNVIDGDGRLIESIDLVQAILDSPFAPILRNATHPDTIEPLPCDLIRLNYIRRIGDDGRWWGMSPGDLVVSMRSLSAFAILDGESRQIKRIIRGSFLYQHAVQHLEGSRFLMLDNMGSDGTYGPSRLLMVDLADRRETTVFPNERTPEHLRSLYTPEAGNVHVSPDRQRAIVVFSNEGIGVEVRISDGEVLNVFRSLHDVSALDQFSNFNESRNDSVTRLILFQLFGVDYIHN